MARNWNIKNLYFYLVCLVTLFLFVGGAISTANSAMQLILPDRPNVPLTQVYFREHREPGAESESAFDPPHLAELEEMRSEQEREFRHYQGWARRSLLNSVALMIIAVPFYFYHWRRIKPGADKGGNDDAG